MSYSVEASEVLGFQVERCVKVLFKNYLILLEDLGVAHDEAMDKLVAALPEEYKAYVDLADYFTEDRGKQLRSKVLGTGNDTLREIDTILQQFNIEFK